MPVALKTNEYTRNATMLTVMAVIDRKLDREHVYGTLIEAVNCNEFLRRAEILGRVIHDLRRGELTAEACQKVLDNFLVEAEVRRQRLQHLMGKIAQMPAEGDTIN
jgi:hypothetical protein